MSGSHLGEYDERLKVTDDEAGEQHEAQFAPGRLDDWGVDVLQESRNDHTRGGNADDGHRGRHDGERTVPAHVLLGQSETAATVVGRPPAVWAGPARVLVLNVRVRVARRTDPTTGVTLLDSLDVTDIA